MMSGQDIHSDRLDWASRRGDALSLEPLPPPPIRDKLRRGLWNLCWLLLCRASPAPLHAWRRFVLRVFGAHVGERAAIYPSCRIWAPWQLRIEADATVGGGATVYNVAPIVIGRAAIISQGAYLCSATHDHDSPNFTLLAAPIHIGKNAWIAAEAFVGPGVRVGENAILGARGVAFKSLPQSEIWVGNPAKCVGVRAGTGRNHL